MMSGVVRAPYVHLENARIDRRHAHSVALAAFFRWYLQEYDTIAGTAGSFFLPGELGTDAPVMLVRSFLDPIPSVTALDRVLPGLSWNSESPVGPG